MFDLANMNLVKWPVRLVSGDAFEETTLHVTFERLTKPELAEIQATDRAEYLASLQKLQRVATDPTKVAEADQATQEVDSAEKRREARLLSRVKGWGEGLESAGQPVPYSIEVARALFALKPVFDAFYGALIECSENARPKTLPPSPGGSVAAAQN
ncbi:MAG TPA: hypothetical protein PLR28_05485 [Dokdonella sp.]|nr:hypothetical protein [Dokdonella sp.]